MNEFFKILNYLTWDKKPYNELTDTEIKSVSNFMLHRFISMEPNYCSLVNEVQSLYGLSIEQTYNIYLSLLPKNKKFFKYIKPSIVKKNEKSNQLASLFEISKREATDYLYIINNEQYEQILEAYGQNSDTTINKNSTKGNKGTKKRKG